MMAPEQAAVPHTVFIEPAEPGVPPVLDGPFARLAKLTIPADKHFIALARLTTIHVAGLLELPIHRLTDLRLAVGEACGVLLTAPPPGDAAPAGPRGSLELICDKFPDRLRIAVRGPAPGRWPEDEDIGWVLMRALVRDITVSRDGGFGTLTLTEPLPAAR
jgi:serine/threonine-protein kinase RsbW